MFAVAHSCIVCSPDYIFIHIHNLSPLHTHTHTHMQGPAGVPGSKGLPGATGMKGEEVSGRNLSNFCRYLCMFIPGKNLINYLFSGHTWK